MKPERIFIVRHGQSVGNVDGGVYKDIPDYALQLTDLGWDQATTTGLIIRPLIGKSSVQYYVSPFWRTRQTYLSIKYALQDGLTVERYYEDPRLREQEWGGKFASREGFRDNDEIERDAYGHFYYRFNGGESCADVFDRVSDFMNTMHRDFKKKDFPRNVIIVTHGMTMRLFLMRWFHCSVEEFEQWANPKNASYFLLELQDDEKYKMMTPIRTHELKHTFQFPWGKNKKDFPFPTQLPYETKPR